MPSTVTGRLLRFALPLVSAIIFIGTGEIALRLIYPGGGRYTLGAPGYPKFEYINVEDEQRGRLDYGPKTPGVPRVMVLGDSITWGTGVRQWQDTWPEQLALQLESSGRPHQFAVLSLPGRELDQHLVQYKLWADDVRPNVLIYQWYVNDIEIFKHRPEVVRSWQRLPWHNALKRHSYLYYFLDNRLHQLLPSPERSYDEYILQDFIPGSFEWTEYERQFQGLAMRAREHTPLRLLVLYPQVPFTPPYPLQSIHDRMKALASATSISIPPVAWVRNTGTLVPKPDARWKVALRLPAHAGRASVLTHAYYARKSLDVAVTFSGNVPHGEIAATVEAIDAETGETLASAPLPADDAPGELWTSRFTLTLPDDVGRDVKIGIGETAADLDLASIDLGVDFGFHVLDLTEALNTFDTHVSIFDAHPNPRAHKVVAEAVGRELERLERSTAAAH